jgi:hypothetical protein
MHTAKTFSALLVVTSYAWDRNITAYLIAINPHGVTWDRKGDWPCCVLSARAAEALDRETFRFGIESHSDRWPR